MKDPDEAIDRVLAGLREVEAPNEMEQRVLEAVQMRAAERSRWRFAVPSMLVRLRPWSPVAAGVVVAALAGSMTLHSRQGTAHELVVTTTQESSQAATVPDVAVEEAEALRLPHELAVTRPQRSKRATQVKAAFNYAAPLVTGMDAASYPAPPMPLTEQEKLMLRIIHKGDPVQLAMLDPQMRSNELADSRADFDAFFAPPKAKDTLPTPGNKAPTTVDNPTENRAR